MEDNIIKITVIISKLTTIKKNPQKSDNSDQPQNLLPLIVRNQRGFTLIELMVVVAIIAVLAAISIPLFTGQMDKAKYGRAEAEMNSQVSLIKLSYVENLAYPDSTAFTALLTENGIDAAAADPWGEAYAYALTDEGIGFTLTCTGSDKAGGAPAETANKWATDIVFTGSTNGMVALESANTIEETTTE